ncbi:GumC family protein [Hirschia maritima]|uniref:GumC family protein n=1 Tax=Hirschia maritima TaxID=1121961 RepID=UPI000368823D|nr:hypothetical protein [Hirschia maritima]
MTQANQTAQMIDRREQRGVNLRVRPRFGLGDVLLQLWRSLWIMLLVFIPLFVLGILFATTLPKNYIAAGTMQVTFDKQYIYDPLVGDAGRGVSIDAEAVVSAEAEKANSPILVRRVLGSLGIENVYPKIAAEISETDNVERIRKLETAAFEAMNSNYWASHGTKSPLLTFAFKHEDPKIAANVVNHFLEQFMDYREIGTDKVDIEAVAGQRRRVGSSLEDAETALRDFLVKNNIGEFEAERITLAETLANLRTEFLSAEAQAKESEGRLNALRAMLPETPETIALHVETDAAQRLLDLQLEREQLLLRYLPDSRAVLELDARIASMKALLESEDSGVRRTGPNPAYQELVSTITSVRTDMDAANSRAAELERQISQVSARQREFVKIQPRYKELSRDRDVLETAMVELATREETKRAEIEISKGSSGSVVILDRALPPTKGSSMKLPVALATLLFSGFTALIAGLLVAFSRKGLSTRRSTEKTIGLPVVGVTSKQK